MNRKEEFAVMLGECSQPVPGLESTLERACKRRRKRTIRHIVRPAAGLAACFAVFVLLVNFCTLAAYACSQIPVLRELAAAVSFSSSLSDAVENEYVQTMDLIQTEGEVTAEINYLIVDQKQVNVFYRLNSEKHKKLFAEAVVMSADGTSPEPCVYHNMGYDAANGELRCLRIEFTDQDVPDSLRVRLRTYPDVETEYSAPAHPAYEPDEELRTEEQEALAEFEFLLEFDPGFTAAGKRFPVNQTVLLDGQSITIAEIEVYPTHMRVDVQESEDNTAWLKGLEFYIESDWGMKFEPVSNGVSATGSADSPSLVSYRADSTYFYEADHLKLVITGAKWLRKDLERTYVNLATGDTGELPEGASLVTAEKQDDGWIVTFRAAWEEGEPLYQLFGQTYYDAEGTEYVMNQWSRTRGIANEKGEVTCFYEEFPLKNYPWEEVWLSPYFFHHWVAENRIVITIQ